MSSLPFIEDLEPNLGACARAISAIIDLQCCDPDDDASQLAYLTEALHEVRAIQITLGQWIDYAKEAGYPSLVETCRAARTDAAHASEEMQ